MYGIMGVLSFSVTGGKCSESVSKFSFTIMIHVVSIKYHDSSKVHYRPALGHTVVNNTKQYHM